ncbi:MAG: hypothetical protein ACOYXU_14535 [Nitrospirota bacterium]
MNGPDAVRAPSAWQIAVGVLMFAVTGVLVGLYLDHWGIVIGGAIFGALIGMGLGKLGAHRFFLSVAAGTLFGAWVGWRAGGTAVVPLMAGTGSAVGGFIGITIEMLVGARRDRREHRAPGS